MKLCSTCKIEKELNQFNRNSSKPDGKQSQCRQCRQISNRKYYLNTPERNPQRQAARIRGKEAARQFVYEYLRTHPCVDCGETDIVTLEFDHLGDKDFSISYMVCRSYGLASIEKEISKCQVRCANCHRRATFNRAGWLKI